jgi:hypothetical protein
MGVSGAPINRNDLILKTPSQAIGIAYTRNKSGYRLRPGFVRTTDLFLTNPVQFSRSFSPCLTFPLSRNENRAARIRWSLTASPVRERGSTDNGVLTLTMKEAGELLQYKFPVEQISKLYQAHKDEYDTDCTGLTIIGSPSLNSAYTWPGHKRPLWYGSSRRRYGK